ncbi:nucleotidyltransferase domain-containing protein [Lapillicoccus sp.]|uniref:nucleotidyltransferase domain-containing protein n=1 Tax=Lapillicoccus sp. TaxID=1909287 RepID=UPI0025E3912B|nr:nucleotidyltransferase domain-containing protein [Lapillicoccus sp.]
MDLRHPLQSVIPSAHGAVLSVLAQTAVPLSGRGLAELTRPAYGYRRVGQVLGDLTTAGIVLRESRPPSFFYRLNRDHVAAEGIVALSNMWSVLLDRIRTDVDGWAPQPRAVWIFGSAARGEAGPDSDIDILLVRPSSASDTETAAGGNDWQARVDDLSDKVTRWSGNPCEILDLDESELEAALARGDRLVRDLRDQAVRVFGREPRALLRTDVD